MPTVRVARSAAAALERLDARRPDCVTTEYRLPDGDGLALAATVRDEFDDVPVVLFTDADDREVADEAIAETEGYVPKRDGGVGRVWAGGVHTLKRINPLRG